MRDGLPAAGRMVIDGRLLDGFTATNAPNKPGIPAIRMEKVSHAHVNGK